MIVNTQHSNMLISPARTVVGKVELFEGSTLSQTFSHTDALSSFTVSRAGEHKFFGFGICQELELKLVDKDRAINVVEGNILKVSFETENADAVYPTPIFYVSADIQRDENTNGLTIKAYDALYKAKYYTVADLALEAPYTVEGMAAAIATKLDLALNLIAPGMSFDTYYETGANFDGTETLRDALNAIAEATQTIYYIDANNRLVFKRLDKDGAAALEIRKADYFTLASKTERILSDICSATELGDNVTSSAEGISGITQYVRNNPFWEMRDDIVSLLDYAILAIGGLGITEFECRWRGNYLLEPGDKIKLITKDDDIVYSYLLHEQYTYNGGLVAETYWSYADFEESPSNPATLGEAIKQTYAKVDKVNREIELVANNMETIPSELAAIKITTSSITSTVQNIEREIGAQDDRLTVIEGDVENYTSKLDQTAEQIKIEIMEEILEEGSTTSVTTTTGFTFNEDGLTVKKGGSEMSTTISEDGMAIYRDETEVLTADNSGVYAANLRATTYLIIGVNSRFEDYDNNQRTGCFWIGGVNK